ncbi:MAG: RloB domain-containing protein [Bacteroidales bacterium]|nr:RloB domain-containing protein [Bacteroidales bacterium]
MGGRRKKNLALREGIFIVGEGITEQYYFNHLKQIKKYNCIVKPRFFGNTDIAQIEKTVKNLLLGYVTIICVFDADVSERNEVEKKKLEKFKRKYSKNKEVIICDSLPSIEFWFLLHYLRTNRNFPNSKMVVQELKKYITNYDKTEKFLEKSKWVEELVEKLTTACINAKNIKSGTGNSYSNIYKAIEKLESFS